MRRILFIVLVFGLGFISHWMLKPAGALPAATQESAVAVASQHDAFASALMLRPGWQAAAYNSYNAYGIWRVQFWDAEGKDMGWADVNPALRRVYNWGVHYGATPQQIETAKPFLWEFLQNHEEIQSMVGDLNQYPADRFTYQYDFNFHWWVVYVPRGWDGIIAYIKFEGDSPSSFTNPQLVRIAFTGVMSYEEWYRVSRDEALTTAFTHQEIADLLREVDWTGDATRVSLGDSATWLVNFDVDGKTMISATVNIEDGTVLNFAVFP